MTYCKTTHDLNNNMDALDMADFKDEVIEESANHIYDQLMSKGTVELKGDQYTLESFIDNTEIDEKLLAELMRGNSKALHDYMHKELSDHSWQLASDNL